MSREENLLKSLEILKDIGVKTDSITAIKHIPAQQGRYREYPEEIHPTLVNALKEKGFAKLYTHQYQSYQHLKTGKNIVVVTPTASGKTLCYNLPVLDSLLKNASTRAIYLFPTKALSQDQRAELDATIKLLPAAATSSSPIRTCCIPASSPITPSGSSCSKTSNTL